MTDVEPTSLQGKRLLIVEDEYVIATDLARTFEEMGVDVVGPAGSVEQALELVEREGGRLDAAVLDINLRDERVFPVADALAARDVPFVFATGYDALMVPPTHADVPRCEKPVDKALLGRLLAQRRR